MNVYLDLTRSFNQGRLRAVICSGQAVVLHRLAMMSKDGDWILREDQETLEHILSVLADRGAVYRFGAPLDLRWMRGGWSSHFEFQDSALRVRTDFFTRPPRIHRAELDELFQARTLDPPVVDLVRLARMKRTMREKDYPIIGELARRMTEARDQLCHSRSARELKQLVVRYHELARELVQERPLLALIGESRERIEQELDAERRRFMRLDEERLEAYRETSRPWATRWASMSKEVEELPLREAHELIVRAASQELPEKVHGGSGDA